MTLGAERPLVLATDLDGTFLEGPETERQALQGLFAAEGEMTTLIFVSGRSLTSIVSLLRTDPLVPPPDYIIGDVGASVVRGGSLQPVEPLQEEIGEKWAGGEVVRKALEPFEALVPQDIPQERRCSFFVGGGRVDDAVRDAVESIGCDLIFSNGRFLDVLPKGVSKGETLRRLLALEKLEPSSAVVAGDTLNDLSLFETAFKGILVSNAEPALWEHAARLESVYRASRPGAAGILEGLRYHRFLPHLPTGREGGPPTFTTDC